MRRLLIAAMVLLIGTTLLCAADEPAGKQQLSEQIQKLEKDWARAVTKQDTGAIDAYLADDYTITGPGGHLSPKEEYIGAIKDGTLKITSLDLTDLSVRVYGDAAVVTGTMSVKGEMSGNDIGGDYAFTDTLAKVDGKWKQVASQVTHCRD